MNANPRSRLDCCRELAVLAFILALLWTAHQVERLREWVGAVVLRRSGTPVVPAEETRSDLDGVFDLPVRESGDRLADMAGGADVALGAAPRALAQEIYFEQQIRRG